MEQIFDQLSQMDIAFDTATQIREKSGVFLYRVHSGGRSYVLKYFENQPDRREIANYHILSSLGIQTIPLIAWTDRAILMEDICTSPHYRLGAPEDMLDCQVASALAQWYRKLHTAGAPYVQAYGDSLYEETELITRDALRCAMERTQTQASPVWALLQSRFEAVMAAIQAPRRTLAYNDFYYTNLIVAKDKSSAFMFDYNLLGKGYVLSDLRNVTYSLGPAAKEAFLDGYGDFDPREQAVDDVASVLTTLILSAQCDPLPWYAQEFIEKVRSGELLSAVRHLLRVF